MTDSPLKLLLMGSGEFTDAVLQIDIMLRDEAGVHSVAVIPTAAGQESDARKWITMAEHHYARLGIDVTGIPAFTRKEADDPSWCDVLQHVDLIYLSGGDPNYLHDTLDGSLLWHETVSRMRTGVILAGSSAGAMVLGGSIARNLRSLRDSTAQPEWTPAFGLVPHAIFPHFDRWRLFPHRLQNFSSTGQELWMGIDEDTGAFVSQGVAHVLGKGSIELHSGETQAIHEAGSSFPLPVHDMR